MKAVFKGVFFLFLLPIAHRAMAQKQIGYNAIYSGTPWFDDHGNIVSAHAANIIKDGNRYYLFGEKHVDSSNRFAGFNCYSSADLYNWKFENIALPVQDTGKLGPNRVGERPKVMRCPKTGAYVMFMHTDDMGYKDQYIGYATATTVTGPYTFRGNLLFNGKPIRKWDMGTFQDSDGAGYLLIHSGEIYKLSDDYLSATEQVIKNMAPECESPAVFKKNGVYFWLGSYRTSWERNDNFYYTATSLKGPWTARGSFVPKGTLTWNSQTTFVLPIVTGKDTTFMFMGDRWSYPLQASSATYVWQPLTVSGNTLSMFNFLEGWQIDKSTGKVHAVAVETIADKNRATGNQQRATDVDKGSVVYSGEWLYAKSDSVTISNSDIKGAYFAAKLTGTQVGFYSFTGPTGGYAQVVVKNSTGKAVVSSIVDMYCAYPISSLVFLSPVLPKGNYTLTVSVLGEHSRWSDKRKTEYGSKGNVVSIGKVIVNQ